MEFVTNGWRRPIFRHCHIADQTESARLIPNARLRNVSERPGWSDNGWGWWKSRVRGGRFWERRTSFWML